jgi:folate-binding protein YgfZ
MDALILSEFHQTQGARFGTLAGAPVVNDYGDETGEYEALRQTAGVVDLSFRGRLCLTGGDRIRFLHGQVTNDIKKLRLGEGCYAALVTTKGKMESDLNIFNLAEEILLDFEPGMTETVTRRLEKYLVADDVQIVDAAPHYGLVSVQGPKSPAAVAALGLFDGIPGAPFNVIKASDAALGELYLANHPRLGSRGFDLFVPNHSLGAVADKLIAAGRQMGGRACGWTAFETARIEAGIPRFGADMNANYLPLECNIESAVVYNKGCYIGQEIINRVHTFGHVNKELRGMVLTGPDGNHAAPGDKLFHRGAEAGQLTSVVHSPTLGTDIALGFVKRECHEIGAELVVKNGGGEIVARVVKLPFV